MEFAVSTEVAIAIEAILLALATLLAVYGISDRKHYAEGTQDFFLATAIFLWIEIALDLVSYSLDAFGVDAFVKYVLYHFAYLFSNMIPWAIARGVISLCGGANGRISRVCDALMILTNALVIVGAPFNLFVSSISNYSALSGPLYPVLYVCPFILMVIAIIWSFRIEESSHLWRFSSIFLTVAAFVAAILYNVFPALPMTVIGQTLGTTGVILTSRSAVVARSARREIELAETRAALIEERNAILVSQIRPHFVQNSLLTIACLCEEDPPAAKELTLEFARYLRGSIDSLNGTDAIPFEDELKHTKTYIAIEHARFGDRFNVVYDIQDVDFRVPSLSLQPIVENAIKHGLMPRPEGGTVWITTERDVGCHRITVRDDGIGFDAEARPDDTKSHVGMANTRDRIERMFGGFLEVRSAPHCGTEVTIELPAVQTKKRVEREGPR